MTQDDKEGLEKLSADIDAFTQNIFDWVSFLGRVDFLYQVYDFKSAVEKKLAEPVKEAM